MSHTVKSHEARGGDCAILASGGRAEFGGIYKSFFKRLLDIFLVLVTAPITVPVVALFALLVSLDGGRPFYSQDRVGQNGRRFVCWKLRSMVVDSDAVFVRYLEQNPQAREEWTVRQKLSCDPRITWIGRFIRAVSIDELPQLWCVLKGEMSLVGPRPFMPEQAPLYTGVAYYRLRPGITGLWQVSERNDSSFAARAVFDARYERDVSLWTDLAIILRTALVVLRGTGK